MSFDFRPLTALVACGLLATPLAAKDTLLDVYQRALQSDPLIREAEATYLAALEARPQARSAVLPQVEFSGSELTRDSSGSNAITQVVLTSPPCPPTNVPCTVTTIRDFEQDFDSVTQWSLQLRQTVFRWDQFMGLRQADKRASQAGANFEAAKQDLLIRVAERYFDVLAAEDFLNAEQGAKEAVARQLEQAEKRFEVGLIAITDVQEAKAAYDQAVAAEIAAKRALASAREFLREITGDYIEALAGPRDPLPLLQPEPPDEDAWVVTALEQNLNLIANRIAKEIARDEIRIRRAGYYPSIDLVASRLDIDSQSDRSNDGGPFLPAPFEQTQDTIQLQFVVPLFAGGLTRSRVQEAVYQHRAAQEALERVARQTERETRDAYLGVISEISRVQALRQAVESSQTALKATEAGFDVGTHTTVDVLDARRRLLLAETNYSRSRYDYLLNVLRLKEASGVVALEDLEQVDGWLE